MSVIPSPAITGRRGEGASILMLFSRFVCCLVTSAGRQLAEQALGVLAGPRGPGAAGGGGGEQGRGQALPWQPWPGHPLVGEELQRLVEPPRVQVAVCGDLV